MFDDACYYATVMENGDPAVIVIMFCSLPVFTELYRNRTGLLPRIISLVAVTSEEAEDISEEWDDHFVYNGEE